MVNATFLFAMVTAGFAATERAHRRNQIFERWTARHLTDPASFQDWRDISRLGTTIELAVAVAVLAWWSGLAGSPTTHDVEGVLRVTWAPLERGFYWAVLALMVAGVVMSAWNLLHPRWTKRRLATQVGLDTIGIVLACFLLPTSLIQVAPGSTGDIEKAALVARWLNLSWTIGVVAAGLVLLVRVIRGVRRLGRVNTPPFAPAINVWH